jgi:hypothetical protein
MQDRRLNMKNQHNKALIEFICDHATVLKKMFKTLIKNLNIEAGFYFAASS